MATPRTPPADEEECLRMDEGEVLHAYQDSLGYWTIGSGILIDVRKGGGITQEESRYLLANRVMAIRTELTQLFTWFLSLSPVRQGVMVNLRYQLGKGGLLGFHFFLRDMALGQWANAANELTSSLAASQAPERFARHAAALTTNSWQ